MNNHFYILILLSFFVFDVLKGQDLSELGYKEKAIQLPIKGNVKKIIETKAQLSLMACKNGVSKKDSGTIRTISAYSFYTNGNLSSFNKTTFNKKDSVTVIDEEQYWENGFKSMKRHQYIQGNKKNQLSETRYNLEGNIEKELFYNNKETLTSWNRFDYNSQGNLIYIMSYKTKGDSLKTMTSKLNKKGQPVELTYYKDVRKNIISKTHELEYDSLGRLIKRTITDHRFRKLKTLIRFYKYFDDDSIEFSMGDFRNDTLHISHRITYNSDFREIKWCGHDCFQIEFHPNGQNKKKISNVKDGTWVREYDIEGNEIKSYTVRNDGEIENPAIAPPSLQYEYDEKGNWVKKVRIGQFQCFCFEREIIYYED